MHKFAWLIIVLASWAPRKAVAQEPVAQQDVHAAGAIAVGEVYRRNAAFQQDGVSPDKLTDALYAIVSGPAQQERDWPRYRKLFHPDAKLLNIDSSGDSLAMHTLTVEDYIEQLGSYFKLQGIWEKEVAHRMETYAHLASRWSTCEYRWQKPSGPPSGRCIAQLNFVNDGNRWWIMSMTWESESSQHPIPDRYLTNAPGADR